MTKEDRILRQIESLQNSRDYADEIESVRLTKIIQKLFNQLDQLEKAGQ